MARSKTASQASSPSWPIEPAPSVYVSRADGSRTLGGDAAELAAAAGVALLPWQERMIRDWGAVDRAGQFVHRRCYACIPRQAGKSIALLVWALYLAVVMGMAVLWTEHNYSTTCEMVRRLKRIVGSKADDPLAPSNGFNGLVEGVVNKTAQESFFFKSGGSVHFTTRTKSTNLGFSFDVVFYDEAQLLTDEQQQVILPTTTSGPRKNPQTVYTGTPPHAGGPGEIFAAIREEAVSAPREDLCAIGWGVEEVGDVADEARWATVNPSLLPGLANLDSIRMGLPPSMSELAFAQDYLGYWLPAHIVAERLISPEDWDACRVQDPPWDEPTAYAVKFSPDGQVGSLAVCVMPREGVPFVEVVANRSMKRGIGWFLSWLVQRQGSVEAIVIDGKSNAQSLNDALLEEGVPEDTIVRPTAADMQAACAAFVDATKLPTEAVGEDGEREDEAASRGISHYGQPALDASATLSGRRAIGRDGGFGFESNENADATLVEACALAYWCAMSIRRNPQQELRIG